MNKYKALDYLKNYVSNKLIRKLISLLVFLFFCSFIIGILPTRYIDVLEDQLYDFRLRSDLLNTVDERIIILDIDEKSISKIGQWPWDRTLLATLVEKLITEYEIKVIGFDIVFPEAENTTTQALLKSLTNHPLFKQKKIRDVLINKKEQLDGDRVFAESIAARNVVVGYTFDILRSEDSTYETKGLLSDPIITKTVLESVDLDFYKAGGYIANYDYLSEATLYGGFFNYHREGSILRKVPLLFQYQGNIYPSLALRTAMVGLDEDNFKFIFDENASEQNSLSLEFLKIGERKIPIDGKSLIYVPFRGNQQSFRYLSVIDVLNGDIPKNIILKDKILLLGTSAAGLTDLVSTPVSETLAGVEVHANIISGILDERFKLKPAYLNSIEVTLLLFMTLLLHYTLPKFGPITTAIVGPAALLLIFAIGILLWHKFNLVIPMANSILLVIILTFLQLCYGFFVESKQKRRMNNFFKQYIPSELVKELDQSTHNLTLNGDCREMSVLFSDVRSFTTISEGMEPGELTQLMNEFLTPITAVIHHNRGTIDKYMGDAVMAFWGAPLKDDNHANHALKSAFEIISAMSDLKTIFKKKGWPEIKVGVGISTGEMQVGNMGSEFRMAYTVMGNTVNLGSRLEGLTKLYGVDIIVSDSTAKEATNFEFRELDRVLVKGKNLPVTIYEPISIIGALTDKQKQELGQYSKAMLCYHNQQWSEAMSLFIDLKKENSLKIYDIYIERIENYLLEAPGKDWNGIFTHHSK